VDGEKVYSHDEVFETIHRRNTADKPDGAYRHTYKRQNASVEKPDGAYRHTYKRKNQFKFDDGEAPSVEGIELDSAKSRVGRSKDDSTYRHSYHPNIGMDYMEAPGKDRQESAWHKMMNAIRGWEPF
jgi:hypothetical protein